jgi:hypothetical protein
MCQPSPLYAASPAMQLLEPWMQARPPKVVDPTARAHIIQLAAGIFERQSALVATIATASAKRLIPIAVTKLSSAAFCATSVCS